MLRFLGSHLLILRLLQFLVVILLILIFCGVVLNCLILQSGSKGFRATCLLVFIICHTLIRFPKEVSQSSRPRVPKFAFARPACLSLCDP